MSNSTAWDLTPFVLPACSFPEPVPEIKSTSTNGNLRSTVQLGLPSGQMLLVDPEAAIYAATKEGSLDARAEWKPFSSSAAMALRQVRFAPFSDAPGPLWRSFEPPHEPAIAGPDGHDLINALDARLLWS